MTRWSLLTHPLALALGAVLALWLAPRTPDCPVREPVAVAPVPAPSARLPLPPLLSPPPSPRSSRPIAEERVVPGEGSLAPSTPPPTDKADLSGPAEDAADILRQERTAEASAARAALVAAAAPSAEQLAHIDLVLADMNADLQAATEEIEARHADGSSADRREVLAWTATALDILVTAEDGLNAALTPEQLAAVPPEALDPLAYVQAVDAE